MSWIFGAYSRTGKLKRYDEFISDPILHSFESKNCYILSGGNPQTCLKTALDDGTICFICGYGIDAEGILSARQWLPYLSNEHSLETLDGHFAVVMINRDQVSCFNDQSCKRNLYFHETDTDVIFTSELSLIRKCRRPEIDFRVLGSYWHSYYPTTFKSYFQAVHALGTSGRAKLNPGLSISYEPWLPREGKDLVAALIDSTLALSKSGTPIAIGLSGGMDCRALYALYLFTGVELTAISYGDMDSIDLQIPSQITGSLNRPFRHISYEQTEPRDSWQAAIDYLDATSLMMNPVNYGYTRLYSLIAETSKLYVSGYWGEIYRMRYNWHYLFSTFKLSKLDYAWLARVLYQPSYPIFTSDVALTLYRGFKEELSSALSEMPPLASYPNARWLDLFFTRYALHAFNLPKLAYFDRFLIDHMPYMQGSVMSAHFSYGMFKEIRERLHRQIIREYYPRLEKFSLALADISAPYHWNQYALKVKLNLHLRKHPYSRISRADTFLIQNRENILDLLSSQRVREYPAYNYPLLKALVSNYYQGQNSLRTPLIKWLGFELGR
ncbi:MAG: hypothetical protein PHI68_07095 [Candidatus Cloacimonetes bacterium]|nr:hypothetical protein [Candidatus Cloacimonadota bacterium]